MNKSLPIVLVLALAGVAWLLFFDGNRASDWAPEDGSSFGRSDEDDPRLLGAEGAGPRPTRPPRPRKKTKAELAAQARDRARRLYLSGVVVAAEGGTPLAGARLWAEPARPPCPRLPDFDQRYAPVLPGSKVGAGVPPPWPSFTTDAKGRFEWVATDAELKAIHRGEVDVFVLARGYVIGLLCRPEKGSDVTVRLARALQMPLRVTDRHQRPIEGAKVYVLPAEGTEAIPGHAGRALSDEEGRCEVDGLLPGDVLVTADHPAYMPTTIGPVNPAKLESLELVLLPALRLTFEIRSDDGSDVKNPVLQWQTDGSAPSRDVLLLKVTASGPPASPLAEVQSVPVRIPCTDRNVQLELKADGFEAWRPEPEPLPPEGGERKVIVSLTRNTSLAPLTVRFQDADGTPIAFRSLQAALDAPIHLGGEEVGAITYETGETLHFPTLPSGRYRFGVRSATFAPAEFEADVLPGEKNETTVKLSEPAQLRIRFIAPERLMVRFQIVHNGRPARAFPLKEDGTPAGGSGPAVATGEKGTLFGGLPAGTCTIEVTSPDLVGTSSSVVLTAGETAELEMEVRKR